MPDFERLAKNVQDDTFSKIFQIVADRQPKTTEGVCDSNQYIECTADDVEEIKAIMLDRVQSNMALDGGFQTITEVRQSIANGLGQMVSDSFFNPVNRIGTTQDPTYYNQSTIPVSMSPNEATSYYTSGGVPAAIIDKKARGMFINGYQFEGPPLWKKEWSDELKEYADSLGFDRKAMETNRDGLLYGGAVMVPHFEKDTPFTYELPMPELIKQGIIEKNCIKYFWHSDRWNTVLIPSYDISSEDYLHPRNVFVPITGKTVNTQRASIIRPNEQPYWGTLRQMGWAVSDMEGWIRAALGYEMCLASIPIMAQQMSVMYRHIPLDGIIAQNGPEYAQQFANGMSRQMVEMSNIAPKTFNMVGEIKTIERHYQGFPELVMLLRQDIGAKSRIPESVLFHSSPTGFSDIDSDTTLKQAEVAKELGNKIIPQYQPSVVMLIYSCFGPNSEQAKMADQVRLTFESPVVLTNEERNAAGTTFSGLFTAFINGGLQPGDAIEMSKAFTPDIELPQDVIDRLNQIADMGLNDEQETGGVESLGQKLRGEAGVLNLGERLRGDAVSDLHSKVSEDDTPGSESTPVGNLFDKVASPLKKLFSKVKE